MVKFIKQQKYRRQEVWETVKGKNIRMSLNFNRSGYERINEDLFAFINIGYKGNAGHIFPNKYDSTTETLFWYGKQKTHSKQPLMKSIIDGFTTIYCFARWNPKPEFTFLGVGRVINYKDNFTDVFREDGTQTFCIEFELSCKDDAVNSTFINNFDTLFEEGLLDETLEGKAKYVRHKTRERNPEIIKSKKKQFLQANHKLFCEVCSFDFDAVYGKRGEGFIECHHNTPLHEKETERITKLEDLSLLCSNCHRMIHRKKTWLTVEELKTIYDKKKTTQPHKSVTVE